MTNIRKCAIIGCGLVGATCAHSLTQSEIFSELVLIDQNRNKAEGDAMDLNDALPFLSPMRIYAGDWCDLADSSVIIIAAGANQKSGETRLDLVKKNTEMMRSVIKQIVKYNAEAILLVVTNPVDILTYVALKLSGFPASRVIGSGTVLDTARLKQLVGKRLRVDPRNVHTFVIGEHGDSELAVWSSANVSGIDLDEFCTLCGNCGDMECLYRIFEDVRDSAYKIISAKGATYYGIAEAVRHICETIVKGGDTIMPVSTLLNGQYGLDGLCLGIPSVVGRDGIKQTFEIPLDESEAKRLRESANTIKSILSSLNIEKSPVF